MDSQKRDRNPAVTAAIVAGVFGIVAAFIGGGCLIVNTLVENELRRTAVVATTAPPAATEAFTPAPDLARTPAAVPPAPEPSPAPAAKDIVIVTAVKTVAILILVLLALIATFLTVPIDIFLLLFGLNFSLTTGLWAFVWQTIVVDWYWNRAETIGLVLGACLLALMFFMSYMQSSER